MRSPVIECQWQDFLGLETAEKFGIIKLKIVCRGGSKAMGSRLAGGEKWRHLQ